MEPTLAIILLVLVLAGVMGGVFIARTASDPPSKFSENRYKIHRVANARYKPKLWTKAER